MRDPVRLVLVRHGLPTAMYGDHLDPGLGDEGRTQAEAAAAALDEAGGPRSVVTSPLHRARETAAALATRWGAEARVEPGVGELAPADPGVDRRSWLRAILLGSWTDAPADAVAWREGVLRALTSLERDTVVVTHYVVVNAAVGAARDDARVTTVAPDYCSRSTFEVVGGRLRLVELGAQRSTSVG